VGCSLRATVTEKFTARELAGSSPKHGVIVFIAGWAN